MPLQTGSLITSSEDPTLRLQVLNHIGTGSFGSVYCCSLSNGLLVAVKTTRGRAPAYEREILNREIALHRRLEQIELERASRSQGPYLQATPIELTAIGAALIMPLLMPLVQQDSTPHCLVVNSIAAGHLPNVLNAFSALNVGLLDIAEKFDFMTQDLKPENLLIGPSSCPNRCFDLLVIDPLRLRDSEVSRHVSIGWDPSIQYDLRHHGQLTNLQQRSKHISVASLASALSIVGDSLPSSALAAKILAPIVDEKRNVTGKLAPTQLQVYAMKALLHQYSDENHIARAVDSFIIQMLPHCLIYWSRCAQDAVQTERVHAHVNLTRYWCDVTQGLTTDNPRHNSIEDVRTVLNYWVHQEPGKLIAQFLQLTRPNTLKNAAQDVVDEEAMKKIEKKESIDERNLLYLDANISATSILEAAKTILRNFHIHPASLIRPEEINSGLFDSLVLYACSMAPRVIKSQELDEDARQIAAEILNAVTNNDSFAISPREYCVVDYRRSNRSDSPGLEDPLQVAGTITLTIKPPNSEEEKETPIVMFLSSDMAENHKELMSTIRTALGNNNHSPTFHQYLSLRLQRKSGSTREREREQEALDSMRATREDYEIALQYLLEGKPLFTHLKDMPNPMEEDNPGSSVEALAAIITRLTSSSSIPTSEQKTGANSPLASATRSTTSTFHSRAEALHRRIAPFSLSMSL